MTKTEFAFWLSLYATAVASLTALWTLFRELWQERPRIDVEPTEAWLVRVKGEQRPMVVRGEDTLKRMDVPVGARRLVLELTVRNRGRRDAKIQQVLRAKNRNVSEVFGDFMAYLPFLAPAETTTTLVHGKDGGYERGDVPLKRFYVVDGANRIHPLTERYRQRLARPFRRRPSVSQPEQPQELQEPTTQG
jgi:hypothetical protein